MASDYQHIHNWFDATKAYVAHQHHRAFRHHAYGVSEATRIFGESVTNADGAIVPVAAIGEQHCCEDFGGVYPTLEMWLEALDEPAWASRVAAPERSSEAMCRSRFGGLEEDYGPIVSWFFDGVDHLSPKTRFRRFHSAGCFDAEVAFGVCIAVSGGRLVPTRLLAEAIIQNEMPLRIIPTPQDWVRLVRRPSWHRQPYRLAA